MYMSLEELLKKADDAYYNQDKPIMTDEEYDKACKEYSNATGKKWNESIVPGEVKDGLPKVTHLYPAKSLDKVNSKEEFEIKSKILSKYGYLVVQHKLDGITIVIYPDGKVVTRGNGNIGEDVTHTVGFLFRRSTITNPIRGELLIPKQALNEINKDRIKRGKEPYKNCRNAIAGMVRNLDPKEMYTNYVKFYAYNLMGSDENEVEQLDMLSKAGYDTVKSSLYTSLVGAWDEVERIGKEREYLDYEIDGAVIKCNNTKASRVLGETVHHYNNAFAYKYENQGEWTELVDVVWETGRTGKITPVAIVEPVDIGGSTITRASLHNPYIIEKLGLCKNDRVFVVKNNDVIPGIAKREPNSTELIPIEQPNTCICGGKITRVYGRENDSYQYYCLSTKCYSKLGRRIENLTKKEALNIENLSIKTIDKMINAGYITKIHDLFLLTVDEIQELPGFARPSAEKLYNNIQRARVCDLASYITACGIPLVGRKKAEDIERKFLTIKNLIDDISNNFGSKLMEIESIGDSIRDSLIENIEMLTELLPIIEITEKVDEPINLHGMDSDEIPMRKSSKQLTIVITGTFKHANGDKMSRTEIEKIIKDYGHKCTGSVSKNTDFVLAGTSPGSKIEKAKKLAVPIITTIEELYDIM